MMKPTKKKSEVPIVYERNQNQNKYKQNILVAIRIRPLSQKEINQKNFNIIKVEDKLIVVFDPIQVMYDQQNKQMLEVLHRSKEQKYVFDKIFEKENNAQIFEETSKKLIKPFLKGYNGTVFAYGPTGSGKTYTMLGDQQANIIGLTVHTIREILQEIENDKENQFTLTVSYVEIYNEQIKDLLTSQNTYLELRDTPNKGIQIAGVTEIKVNSVNQITQLLFQGNRRRTTEATNANLTSSRSHAVFQLYLKSQKRTKNIEMNQLCSKLSLIDLAGSERGSVTENRGIRLTEGANINRSLLALANCINALGDNTKQGEFVPYRDSKLTRMLKDSLGGNCKTIMIVNVCPASNQFEETINTLKYANRAKNIQTKQYVTKNLVQYHIAEYKNIIEELRNEIDTLKAQINSDGIEQIESTPKDNTNDTYEEKYQAANLSDEKSPSMQASSVQYVCSVCKQNREQTNQEMQRLKEEIFENFQERIQLRRALMELEEQNALNLLDVNKQQEEVKKWQNTYSQTNGNKELTKNDIPNNIKEIVKTIQTLKINTDKNAIRREIMNLQLIENISVGKRIRDTIPEKIKSQEQRDYLEILIKNHILEIQNIELEIHLSLQEKSITDLKNIISNQQNIIRQNNTDNPNNDYYVLQISQQNNLQQENSPQGTNNNEQNLEKLLYEENDIENVENYDDEYLNNLMSLIEKTQIEKEKTQELKFKLVNIHSKDDSDNKQNQKQKNKKKKVDSSNNINAKNQQGQQLNFAPIVKSLNKQKQNNDLAQINEKTSDKNSKQEKSKQQQIDQNMDFQCQGVGFKMQKK